MQKYSKSPFPQGVRRVWLVERNEEHVVIFHTIVGGFGAPLLIQTHIQPI